MVKNSVDVVTNEEAAEQNASAPTRSSYTSYSATLFHILIVSIGPTVFILPKVYAMVGYVNASVGIVVISILYAFNLHSLLRSATIVQSRVGRSNLSFAEVVKYAFERGRFDLTLWAPLMYQAMNVLFVISWGGELAFTMVFLANSLEDLFASFGNALTNVQSVIIVLSVPCLLLNLIPCDKLSVLGAATTFVDIFFVLFVMYELYADFDTTRLARCEAFRPPTNIPQFVATVFFTLNFTGLAIPSRNLMKKPEKFESGLGVLHVSLLIISFANIVFGFSGYLRYGQEVQESLILNLSFDTAFSRWMLALYCLATFFSIPFLYFVLFKVVWDEWVQKLAKNTRMGESLACKLLTSICTNVALLIIILLVPDLNMFTTLGGLVCGVMDSFVIPAVLEIILYPKYGSKNRFILIIMKNITIILIGLLLFFFGIIACMTMTFVNLKDNIKG